MVNTAFARRLGRLAAAALLLMLGMGALSGVAPAADALPVAATPAPPPRLERLEELDEVQVKGTKLWQMRKEIVDAEDRFFALYNELNKDRDYDVRCANEAPLGTRLKRRICRVQFFEEAEAAQARAFLTGEYAPSPEMVMLERQDEYRKNMLKVINSDPRLLRLVREHAAMQKRYETERKKRFKGRWILFE